MSLVTWDQSLDVKVSEMNSEHKQWILYINELHQAHVATKPKEFILSAYDRMFNYIREHFGHEENYLKDIKYPLFDEHKQAHEEFIEKIQDHRNILSKSGQLDENYFGFLSGWLIRHIKIVDTQYGNFVERRKAG